MPRGWLPVKFTEDHQEKEVIEADILSLRARADLFHLRIKAQMALLNWGLNFEANMRPQDIYQPEDLEGYVQGYLNLVCVLQYPYIAIGSRFKIDLPGEIQAELLFDETTGNVIVSPVDYSTDVLNLLKNSSMD